MYKFRLICTQVLARYSYSKRALSWATNRAFCFRLLGNESSTKKPLLEIQDSLSQRLYSRKEGFLPVTLLDVVIVFSRPKQILIEMRERKVI